MRQLHNKNITNYLKNSIYNYDISKKITYCILQPLIKIRNIKIISPPYTKRLNILMFITLSMQHSSIFNRTYTIFSLEGCAEVALVVVAQFYADIVDGNMRKLPLQRLVIIAIVGLYSIRVIVGIDWLSHEFTYLQFFSTLVPVLLVYCYFPGLKQGKKV